MTADDTPLATLAGAILDGQPIDWETAGSNTQDADRPLLERLRQIAALADAHRADVPETWGPLRILERVRKGALGESTLPGRSTSTMASRPVTQSPRRAMSARCTPEPGF